MSRRTAARQEHPHHRPATAHGRARTPPPPRRVSGPSVRGGAVALPAPRRRGTTGVFERVVRLPDHRLVDRLLRGRAWIWVVGILLGGIVAMQVSLLKLNAGISNAVEASATLERQNADLEASIARLSSGERIRDAAEADGMIMAPAGEVRYLRVRPALDPTRAATRMRPVSDVARQLMANGGMLPMAVAAGTAGAVAQAPGTGTTAPATGISAAGTGTGTAGAGTGTGTAGAGTGTAGTGTTPAAPAAGTAGGATAAAGTPATAGAAAPAGGTTAAPTAGQG